ncbi:MAG: bifunctional adenosylcobinamide kinase/adenosylcobinamide-phosphate guanylyltransferase [Thermomicrobiales bacterium]
MGRLILVLGGARSGKSAFAERLARGSGGDDVLYVATATITDDEMAARVARHRADRSAAWETVELPLRVGDALRERTALPPVILLDCLTLLLSTPALTNPDLSEAAIEEHATAEVDGLLRLRDGYPGTLIVVSNEVGMGLHPNSALGRIYRDALGRANQRLAARADAAYLLVAGIPLDLMRLRSHIVDAV